MTSELESAFRGEVPEGWHVVNPAYMAELKAALAERDRLAAVIDEAKEELEQDRPSAMRVVKAYIVLAYVDTNAVLAERDAEKWDEGMRMALEAGEDTTDRLGNLYRIDWLNRMEHEREQNPYRRGTGR